MTGKHIAETILSQLGGKVNAMIGMKDGVYGDNFLQFGWKVRGARNKANKVRITLEPSDTYTVEFFSIRGVNVSPKGTFSDVYCDQLKALFERETGLCLSLGRPVTVVGE